MSLHPRRRKLAAQWPTMLWLVAVWVLLWGDFTIGNLLAGAVIAVAVTGALRMTPIDFHGRLHPWGLVVLVARFVRDLVHASVEVSWVALRPRHTPHGAVIGVQLRNHSDLYLTMTAELCSLVPGSLVVEAHRLTGMLYLHVLDVEQSGGVEKARQAVLDQEERVLRAFASDEEMRDAGLEPHPRREARAGRGPRTEVGA